MVCTYQTGRVTETAAKNIKKEIKLAFIIRNEIQSQEKPACIKCTGYRGIE
jgi:hypothetical protein